MATADYPDYDALNLVLAAIGSPAQSGGKSLLDVINELANVISQIQLGSPAITNPVLQYNSGFAATLASGAETGSGPFATTGTSYAVSITPWNTSASTQPVCELAITITDSGSNVVDNVIWDLPMSHGGGFANYVLTGPITGTGITFGLTNYNNVSMRFTMTLTTTNLPLYKHSGQAINFGTIDTFTVPTGAFSPELLLAQVSPTIAAGSTNTYMLPPSSGSIQMSIRNRAAAGLLQAELYAYSSGNTFAGTSGAPLWAAVATGNANQSAAIPVPRCSTILTLKNNGTSGTTMDLGVTSVPT